ncbi:glycosyltransferase family 4 protein [Acinetobacter bereziniae]|uniref:glycosyltransferase family 4 protein n=1 Tax=Acinetobacter bereziniae TaxID=106648 RepID=UPI0021D0AF00|nr:glycosyltransferase family 4 protein [Acinetobacter bereziniae]MCU4435051.1 glycosyltransferase family 4 protein [Acinetobacter bereziniae]MCV2444690.1 glycosyltransferase family 4 protein [Acinetobacter bereziniae]
MKRICFLIGNIDHSGGTERVTTLIANALSNYKNCQIHILSLHGGGLPFFEQDKKMINHHLFDFKVSMKKNFLQAIRKIRSYIIYNKIDTLIVVDSISCIFTVPACIGLKVNHICWEHFNFNVNLGIKYRDIGRKWAAKYCDYVVTLTKRDKELWEQGLKKIKAKIIPIPNPTPYENMQNTPSLEFKTILSLGRLTHQKGFDFLIDAWAQVCKHNNDWTLRIVGSGEDEKALKDQAQYLGIADRIEFLPATKDVGEYYKTSSFYCMSSRFEGLPMVLLEAQSFSLPLISFNCNTGPSDIIENGKNGYLVESENVEELADRLLYVTKMDLDKYQKMVNLSKLNSYKFYLDNILNHWIDII